MKINGIEIKNFIIQEFVPKAFYDRMGDEFSLRGIDPRLIYIAQFLRGMYGSITINDWAFGGIKDARGLRVPDHEDIWC